jgi:N,N'-diacetylchitobiose transport system permease protein
LAATQTIDEEALELKPRPRRRKRSTGAGQDAGLLPYFLLVPAGLVLAAVVGWPLVQLVIMSFQHYGASSDFTGTPFVGFAEYQKVLGDSQFWSSVERTIAFAGANVVLSIVFSMGISLLLNRVSKPVRLIMMAVLMLVWAVPSTVSTQLFRWLFDAEFGVVDWFLSLIGLHSYRTHDWFANPTQGLEVAAMIVIWGAIPFLAITLNAGLGLIPKEVIEAAKTDGANWWQVFRAVLFPYLRPLLIIVTTLSVIWDTGVFNQIYILRNGHPEPGYYTLGIYSYVEAFSTIYGDDNYSYGAAMAIIMVLIMGVFMIGYIRQLLKIGQDS